MRTDRVTCGDSWNGWTTCSGSGSTAFGCPRSTTRRCGTAATTSGTFTKSLPEFGTVDDFVALLDAAHQRGIRVITDLVMNHTSESHPWFQESRHDPDGPYGDYYVWSDTSEKYTDARIIFVDTEKSNWTFDPVRRQFYWHRFFSHQPDLNYDNPAVQEAMIDVMRFWLDLGIDGFRLDAVPYLFEREGTNCENLPETHAFLKRDPRRRSTTSYPDRMMLAEANQWPADVRPVLRRPAGDEMPHGVPLPADAAHLHGGPRGSRASRSRRSWRRRRRSPTLAQWGLFLRNHDELTLEMVTDDERDYMYAEYAKDPRMKANVGIRRRLAPLLDNDRNQIAAVQRAAAVAARLAGPLLRRRDRHGRQRSGLGDRNGVRTPMQWTPDRNAGFSTANPGRLYLPPSQDPVYGYQAVNVEAQRDTSTSLLNFTRMMLAVRRRHEAFAIGTFEELGGSNPSVLAFVRQVADDGDTVMCVNNLSRFPQPIELNLQHWSGCTPVELTGHVEFPRIGHLPYLLTLPGHGFYWFQLSASEENA